MRKATSVKELSCPLGYEQVERSKRGILRKSEVILVDTGGMLPQRERCTQGHAKRETAMFYFINPDITIFI